MTGGILGEEPWTVLGEVSGIGTDDAELDWNTLDVGPGHIPLS